MRFDCAGAAFSRVRASARVELFGHFWAPKVGFWGPFGSRLGDFLRSVQLLGPEGGPDR